MTGPTLLYYGDNLDVLRRHVKDDSVDAVAGSGSRVWAGVQLPDSGGPIEQAWQQTQPEPLRPLDGSVWDGPPLPDAGGPLPQAGRQAGTVTPRTLGPGMRSR